jgi:hypothetical protein
MFLLQVI